MGWLNTLPLLLLSLGGIPGLFRIMNSNYLAGWPTPFLPQRLLLVIFASEVWSHNELRKLIFNMQRLSCALG